MHSAVAESASVAAVPADNRQASDNSVENSYKPSFILLSVPNELWDLH